MTKSKRFYIDCPYSDKDKCKKLGGYWDQKARRWYVPEGVVAIHHGYVHIWIGAVVQHEYICCIFHGGVYHFVRFARVDDGYVFVKYIQVMIYYRSDSYAGHVKTIEKFIKIHVVLCA